MLGMVAGVLHRRGGVDAQAAVAMACCCRAWRRSTELVEELVLDARAARGVWGRAGGWGVVIGTFPFARAVTVVGAPAPTASAPGESVRGGATWARDVAETCLARLPNLVRLRIEDAGLDDDAAHALAGCIGVCGTAQGDATAENAEVEAEAASSASSATPSAAPAFLGEPPSECKLESLELPGNCIRDAGAMALVVAAAGAPRLRRLDLADNLVGRGGRRAIEEALSLEGFNDRLDVVLAGNGGEGRWPPNVGLFEALGMAVDAAILFVAEAVGTVVEALRDGIQDANRESLLEEGRSRLESDTGRSDGEGESPGGEEPTPSETV